MTRVELNNGDRAKPFDDVPFEDLYRRLFDAGAVNSQTELAKLLKLGRAAISYVSKKGTVPREWRIRLERAGISWQWAAYGHGNKSISPQSLQDSDIEIVGRCVAKCCRVV